MGIEAWHFLSTAEYGQSCIPSHTGSRPGQGTEQRPVLTAGREPWHIPPAQRWPSICSNLSLALSALPHFANSARMLKRAVCQPPSTGITAWMRAAQGSLQPTADFLGPGEKPQPLRSGVDLTTTWRHLLSVTPRQFAFPAALHTFAPSLTTNQRHLCSSLLLFHAVGHSGPSAERPLLHTDPSQLV